MCAFSGECEFAICITFEGDIVADEIADDAVGTADHEVYGFFVVFVMACTHGVFKIVVIVFFSAEHADSALCKKGIRLVCLLFCDHQNFHPGRQIQSAVKPCGSGSYYYGVVIFIHFFILLPDNPDFPFIISASIPPDMIGVKTPVYIVIDINKTNNMIYQKSWSDFTSNQLHKHMIYFFFTIPQTSSNIFFSSQTS